MLFFSEYLARIGCAFLTGTVIGIERQYRQRNAGLRTNILVSAGAAAFTVISSAITSGSGDPSRVAAQIVSGIGFIGGGLIIKDGINVRGINTAATIWCSAACGTLSGVGLYAEAIALAVLIIVIHFIFRPISALIERKASSISRYLIYIDCTPEISAKIQQMIMDTLSFNNDIKLNSLYYKHKEDNELTTIHCYMKISRNPIAVLNLLVSRIRSQSGVVSINWKKNDSGEEDF